MFEFLTEGEENTFTILKADHDKAKELFDAYEKAESASEKRSIAAQAILELKIHTLIEEEIFYPAVRPHLEKKQMNEADEEHHVAKFLIAELEHMDVGHDHYDAKFKVLSENVRHHIKEEEGEMFPAARHTPLDFDRLGGELLARKQELKQNGVPEMEEDEMIAAFGTRNDSPARLARANSATPAKRKALPENKVIKLKTGAAKRKPAKAAKPVKAKSVKPAKAKARKMLKPSKKVKPAIRKAAIAKTQSRKAQRGVRR